MSDGLSILKVEGKDFMKDYRGISERVRELTIEDLGERSAKYLQTRRELLRMQESYLFSPHCFVVEDLVRKVREMEDRLIRSAA